MSQGWDNSLGWQVERQPFKTCSGVWLHRWVLDAKASTWQTCLASPLPGAPTCPLLPSWALEECSHRNVLISLQGVLTSLKPLQEGCVLTEASLDTLVKRPTPPPLFTHCLALLSLLECMLCAQLPRVLFSCHWFLLHCFPHLDVGPVLMP